jgi:hypothetical protein
LRECATDNQRGREKTDDGFGFHGVFLGDFSLVSFFLKAHKIEGPPLPSRAPKVTRL